MNFDFPTILVLGTALTGLVWAADAMLFAPARRKRGQALIADGVGRDSNAFSQAVKEPVLVEYSRSFFPIILAVLVLRSFVVEPFRIPSGSMMPTLLVGDFILVNKFTYGLRLPVANTKVWENNLPQRGDVVVFRYPRDPSVDYIKRVIGVPGDVIRYYNKALTVNGQPAEQLAIGNYQASGAGARMQGASEREEDLLGVEHRILVSPGVPSWQGEFTVPQGQYFVMGDNRDNSNDSRVWGTVPEENLVGKAFMIWMNWDPDSGEFGFDRIGRKIQ
ncbi:MAG: signal peptidase I [Chromatiales bacterium]|nr:signal peptidase I [Chromatiales bacterium]